MVREIELQSTQLGFLQVTISLHRILVVNMRVGSTNNNCLTLGTNVKYGFLWCHIQRNLTQYTANFIEGLSSEKMKVNTGIYEAPPPSTGMAPATCLACAAGSDHTDFTPTSQEPTDQSEGEQNKCLV